MIIYTKTIRMNTNQLPFMAALSLLLFAGCQTQTTEAKDAPPDSATAKETFPLSNLVAEKKEVPDEVMKKLHAQHHGHKVLERRTVPGPFTPPGMKYYIDHAVTLDKMPTINPGPGEYVHVMEGQRFGYNNLTIGITETFPGGYPPMHTHEGEESHVLLDGEIEYALGDTLFTIKGPYMVNIPPMVPHAFKNIGNKTANLVVVFPTNVWKYDVVDYFPFEKKESKKGKQ